MRHESAHVAAMNATDVLHPPVAAQVGHCTSLSVHAAACFAAQSWRSDSFTSIAVAGCTAKRPGAARAEGLSDRHPLCTEPIVTSRLHGVRRREAIGTGTAMRGHAWHKMNGVHPSQLEHVGSTVSDTPMQRIHEACSRERSSYVQRKWLRWPG